MVDIYMYKKRILNNKFKASSNNAFTSVVGSLEKKHLYIKFGIQAILCYPRLRL